MCCVVYTQFENMNNNKGYSNSSNNRAALPIPPLQKTQNQFQQQSQNQKCKYVQTMLNAFKQFQYTHNANQLKDYVNKNRFQMLTLFQQVEKLKDQVDRESDILKNKNIQSNRAAQKDEAGFDRNRSITPNKKSLSQDKRINFQSYNPNNALNAKQYQQQLYLNEKLQREYEQLARIRNQPYVHKRESSKSSSPVASYQTSFANSNATSQVSISEARQKEYLNQIDFTIQQMNVEQQKITKENENLATKLSSTPFYKQWILMCKEAQGSRHFNTRLKEQLQKKKLQLMNLQKSA